MHHGVGEDGVLVHRVGQRAPSPEEGDVDGRAGGEALPTSAPTDAGRATEFFVRPIPNPLDCGLATLAPLLSLTAFPQPMAGWC